MVKNNDQAEPLDGERDFAQDTLKPSIILDQLKAHDQRMRAHAPAWSLAKSMYLTSYWKHLRASTDRETSAGTVNWTEVEVNRIFPIVGSYLAALYPRAQRSIVTSDPASLTGNPERAQLANNRWLASHRVHQRVMSGIRQAILYPGAGAKVGYSPGTGNPLDRVWIRIIPWWEMVLDFDVGDVEDQRFVGHVYYRIKDDIKKEYGLENLVGTRREDFLARRDHGAGTDSGRDRREHGVGKRAKAKADEDAFVRVLEIVNLVDDVECDGAIYHGRIEIYILGQSGKKYDRPIYIGPVPFAKFDGTPLPHIIPLIFNYEPEFPLRGIPHSARMLPQMQELNAYRAHMANATRKDTRQYMARKGAFDADTLTKISEGVEGYIAEVLDSFERPLNDAMAPIPNNPMSSNIDRYMMYVENDLERAVAQSPQARGEITKATAFEVQTVQQYTESEFGMHAAIKDQWLAEILRVFLRALIGAMQDAGDYAGAFKEEQVKLASVGARPDGIPQDEEQTKQDMKSEVSSEITGGQAPFVPSDFSAPLGTHEVQQDVTAIVQETLKLIDNRHNIVEVTVEDLDAEFDISFVEGGRTPLTDAAMQQNLVALLQPYLQLWQMVQEGGPVAPLAKAYMQVIAERFDLPKDLHPAELLAAVQEEAAQQPPPEEGGAPPPGPGGGKEVPPELRKILEQVLTMPAAEALGVLSKLFEGSPEMQQIIAQIAQMPPEQQAAMIEDMVTALLRGGPNEQQVPPPEEVPPEMTSAVPRAGGPPGAPIPPPAPPPQGMV